MLTEENETGNIPTHYEHTNRHANDRRTNSVYITKIFRGKVKWIGPERLHETSIDRTKKNKPEEQKNLVLSEMQKEQLNGKRVEKPPQPGFHKNGLVVISKNKDY